MSGIIKRLMKCCEDDYSDERYSNDNEYKEQAENADYCISAIRRELVDSQKLDIMLNSIEKCNEIEKQYVFQDGIRFGYELHKIISDY